MRESVNNKTRETNFEVSVEKISSSHLIQEREELGGFCLSHTDFLKG